MSWLKNITECIENQGGRKYLKTLRRLGGGFPDVTQETEQREEGNKEKFNLINNK